MARGIAPTAASVLFAFSIEHQIMGGYFVWVVLALISLLAVPLSLRVRDVPAPRYHVAHEDDEVSTGLYTRSQEVDGGQNTAVESLSTLAVRADETPGTRSQSQ